MYFTIEDLPYSERLLQRNTPCVAMSPGPKEPTAPQMDKFFEPIVAEIDQLQQGESRFSDLADAMNIYMTFVASRCTRTRPLGRLMSSTSTVTYSAVPATLQSLWRCSSRARERILRVVPTQILGK